MSLLTEPIWTSVSHYCEFPDYKSDTTLSLILVPISLVIMSTYIIYYLTLRWLIFRRIIRQSEQSLSVLYTIFCTITLCITTVYAILNTIYIKTKTFIKSFTDILSVLTKVLRLCPQKLFLYPILLIITFILNIQLSAFVALYYVYSISQNYTSILYNGFTISSFYHAIPFIEDLLLAYNVLREKTTLSQKLSVLVMTLKKTCKFDSVVMSALTELNDKNLNLESLTSIFTDNPIIDTKETDEFILQAGYLDSFGELLDNWDALRVSPTYTHFRKLYLIVLASNVFAAAGISFDKKGYTSLEEAMIKREIEFSSDGCVLFFLKSIHFMATTGVRIHREGSFSAVFYSNKKIDTWFAMHHWLIANVAFLKDSLSPQAPLDPTGQPFSESLYIQNLRSAIAEAKILQNYIDVTSPRQTIHFRNKSLELSRLFADLMIKTACDTDRPLPFAILVNGTPAVGKSTFVNILFHVFGALSIPDLKETYQRGDWYKYTRNFADSFWSGFTSAMWCIILDDIAFQNKANSTPGGDPSCVEIIQVINTMAFVPNQADLADKGKTPLRAKLVIGTTNTKDMNSVTYFSTPSAAQRRFKHVITLTVRDAYKLKDADGLGFQLDSSKVKFGGSDSYIESLPNFWNIQVEHVTVDGIDGKNAVYTTVFQDDNIENFLTFYHDIIKEHYLTLKAMKASQGVLASFELCSTCCKEKSRCTCVALQSANQLNDHAEFHLEPQAPRPIAVLQLPESIKILFFNNLIKVAIFCDHPLNQFCRFTGYQNDFVGWFERRYNIDIHRYALAQRVVHNYDSLWVALILGLISSVMVLLIKLFSKDKRKRRKKKPKHELQGQMIPKVIGTERQNFWHKDTPVTAWSIPRGSLSIKSSDTINLVSRNTIILRIHKESPEGLKYVTTVRAVGVESYYYLTVNHAFNDVTENFKIDVIGAPFGGSNSNCPALVNKNLDIFYKGDIAVIRLTGYNQCRNIRALIPENNEFTYTGTGTLISRLQNTGEIKVIPLTQLQWMTTTISSTETIKGPRYFCNSALLAGSCGSPILVKLTHKDRYVFSSLHRAGSNSMPAHLVEFEPYKNSVGLSQQISLQLFDSLKSKFTGYEPLSFDESNLGSISKNIQLQCLHYKSPINFIEDGILNVYGSLDMPRSHRHSSVKPHYLSEYFIERGYEINKFTPDLRSWKPWRRALLAKTKPVWRVKTDILNEVVESFKQDILRDLPIQLLKDVLHPVSNKIAINGFPAVAFIDAFDRSTSAGHPWRKSKSSLQVDCEPDEVFQDPVAYNSEVMNRVAAMEDKYKSKMRCCPIYTASLKDEPVSAKKILSGKVRVFSGAPLDFTILVRKYFITFIRLVQRNRDTFEAEPGLIAQSDEWHKLREYLTYFGVDKIFDGDYEGFDNTMPPEFMFGVFDIIDFLFRLSTNFSDEDLSIVQGVATDIIFSLVNFNGDLLMFFGTNPSGNPLTVIINSLVNSLYMRYIYHLLSPNKSSRDFKENVRLKTYGDDNICGSRVDWFNHTTVSNKFLTELNIVYTAADKESKSVPFKNIDACSFLKRTWHFVPELKQYLAKLDHDSINKMLTVWVESKSISHQEQALATIESAYREYFYYGKKTFEARAILLNTAIDDNDLRFLLKDRKLPSWSDMIRDYKANSRNDASMQDLYKFHNFELQSNDTYECAAYLFYPIWFLKWWYTIAFVCSTTLGLCWIAIRYISGLGKWLGDKFEPFETERLKYPIVFKMIMYFRDLMSIGTIIVRDLYVQCQAYLILQTIEYFVCGWVKSIEYDPISQY